MNGCDYLVWMDLEMSGLNPETDTILEIATVVTNADLDIVAEGPNLAIHHATDVLESMDAWCKEHHGASGLSRRVLASTIDMAAAEAQTLDFVQRYCPPKASPLCGNSVHQDRRFLVRYMPHLEAYLHYRNIDVSTVKELVRRWYPGIEVPPKKSVHLALEDIHESIDELRFYRRHVFRDRHTPT